MTRHDLPRTPSAYSGLWRYPPRKPKRRLSPAFWAPIAALVILAGAAAWADDSAVISGQSDRISVAPPPGYRAVPDVLLLGEETSGEIHIYRWEGM